MTSIAILITNEKISKLNLSYTKLRDWVNVFTLLSEKSVDEPMFEENIREREAKELKTIYNHYLDKRSHMMKITQFKVEDIFDDFLNKDSNSPGQITWLKTFYS